MNNTIKLSDGQISSIVELVNEEMNANNIAGDGAYNTYWENLKTVLSYPAAKCLGKG